MSPLVTIWFNNYYLLLKTIERLNVIHLWFIVSRFLGFLALKYGDVNKLKSIPHCHSVGLY